MERAEQQTALDCPQNARPREDSGQSDLRKLVCDSLDLVVPRAQDRNVSGASGSNSSTHGIPHHDVALLKQPLHSGRDALNVLLNVRRVLARGRLEDPALNDLAQGAAVLFEAGLNSYETL